MQQLICRSTAFARRYTKACGGIALWVQVDNQDALAQGNKGCTKVDRGGGFAHAALLIGDRQDPWAVLFRHGATFQSSSQRRRGRLRSG